MNVPDFLDKSATLMRAYRMLPWLIGDHCNIFVESRGEESWQYIDEVVEDGRISESVLRDYMFLADKFGIKERLNYEMSIWSFKEVAGFANEDALKLLRRARKNHWSTKDLRAVAKKKREEEQ